METTEHQGFQWVPHEGVSPARCNPGEGPGEEEGSQKLTPGWRLSEGATNGVT